MTTVTEVAGMLAVESVDGPWIAQFAVEKAASVKELGHGLEIRMALKAEPPYFAMFFLEAFSEDPGVPQTPELMKRAGELLDEFITIAHGNKVIFGADIVSELLTQGYRVGVWSHKDGRPLPEGIPQQFVCFYGESARMNFCLTMLQQGLE